MGGIGDGVAFITRYNPMRNGSGKGKGVPMKLTMLGTGSALVTRCYNTCFVLSEGQNHLLVDGGGGNGIFTQLEKAGIDWCDIHEVFVTHKHLDHLLGIVWIVRMICQYMEHGDYEGEATLYANDEVAPLLKEIIDNTIRAKDARHLGERLHVVIVDDGQEHEILGHRVTFFDIGSTKAKQFGFSVDLDGGNRLVCLGDEPYNACCRGYVEGSTWLMHEAFCLKSQADVYEPYEKYHSTVADACETAAALGVENLILYHTEDDTGPNRLRLYQEEGGRFYAGNILVPDDLEVINL